MARIDEAQVRSLLVRCFAGGYLADASADPPLEAVCFDGWNRGFCFHPIRLTENEAEIQLLLAELPVRLFDSAVGAPLSDMCLDADEETWGSFEMAHGLFCLAAALGRGVILPCSARIAESQRDAWARLPGGVPNVWVTP